MQSPEGEACDGSHDAVGLPIDEWHNSAPDIYLMRPDGRFETVVQERDQPPEELARRISTLIDESI